MASGVGWSPDRSGPLHTTLFCAAGKNPFPTAPFADYR